MFYSIRKFTTLLRMTGNLLKDIRKRRATKKKREKKKQKGKERDRERRQCPFLLTFGEMILNCISLEEFKKTVVCL